MAKKKVSQARKLRRPKPVPVYATAAIFDGGAVKLEFVFQPPDARTLGDQLVNAIVRDNGLQQHE